MTFSSALPYTPHKTKPRFLGVCFRFVRTSFFSCLFPLRRCFYKLYFVLLHNVYIAHKNVELVSVFFSVFCCLLRFLENGA